MLSRSGSGTNSQLDDTNERRKYVSVHTSTHGSLLLFAQGFEV